MIIIIINAAAAIRKAQPTQVARTHLRRSRSKSPLVTPPTLPPNQPQLLHAMETTGVEQTMNKVFIIMNFRKQKGKEFRGKTHDDDGGKIKTSN